MPLDALHQDASRPPVGPPARSWSRAIWCHGPARDCREPPRCPPSRAKLSWSRATSPGREPTPSDASQTRASPRTLQARDCREPYASRSSAPNPRPHTRPGGPSAAVRQPALWRAHAGFCGGLLTFLTTHEKCRPELSGQMLAALAGGHGTWTAETKWYSHRRQKCRP